MTVTNVNNRHLSYTVTNMDCLNEVSLIEQTLKPISGINEVSCNIVSREVYVTHTDVTSDEDIAKLLKDAGLIVGARTSFLVSRVIGGWSFVQKAREDSRRLFNIERYEPGILIIEEMITRLRAVLMTALVTLSGFVLVGLAMGTGVEVQRLLIILVIGGLTSAAVLTWFILPALLSLFTHSMQNSDINLAKEID